MARALSHLLLATVLAASLLPLALAQPYLCTNTSGLLTAAQSGNWNLTNWPVQNQFFADPDATVIVANQPFASMFGYAFPTGSLVMWGGSSSVLGASLQDAPVYQYWRSLSVATPYQAGVGNAQCAHRRSYLRLYVIGDSYSGTANAGAPYVFTSVNEWNWTNTLSAATATTWASATRALLYTGCVVDINDRVYSLGVSDIYSSADNGTTWTRITPTVSYTPRSAFSYGIFTGLSGADIMVVAGGLSSPGNTLLNDVWASQTSGSTWVRTTFTAPWAPRLGANLAIFGNGAMVLHGGSTNIPASSTPSYFSDAWISFDGAATWQLLIASTGVARSLGGVVFDGQGYLYIFSGYNTANAGANDAWRSNLALGNIQQWGSGATATALTIPSGYSACTPYFNLGAQQAAPSSTGSAVTTSTGSSSGSIVLTCTATGLPTAAQAGGTWNFTNWPVVNQFFADPDASVIVANQPFASMFGYAFPTGSLVMWGGSASVLGASLQDAPQYQYWRSLSVATPYQAGVGNAQCAHRRSYLRLYVIGDSYSGTANAGAPYVFTSVNEWNWTNTLSAATATTWASATRALLYTGCVVDINDRVYSLGVSDIYSSADNGTTWTRITPTVSYTPRSAFSYGIFTGLSGADIMVVAGGVSTSNSLLNDVWASQTSGNTWIRTTYTAPWAPRLGANLAFFSNGAMVIHGGSTGIPSTSSPTYYSDAWISLDGAATWQLLMQNTGIARSLGAIVFDAQGYLYIFSGYNTANAGAGDAWRSNLAMANIQSWGAGATASALSIPTGYSACTPYFNLGAQQAAPASTGAGGGVAAASTAPALQLTCVATGLGTDGKWNFSYWPVVNQFFADPDATAIVANVGYTSMFGFAFPAGSFLIWGGSSSVLGASLNDAPQLQYWRSLSVATPYQAGVGNAQCAHRRSYLRLYVIGDSYSGSANAGAPYVFASANEWNWTNTLSAATATTWASATRALLYTGCVVDINDRVYSLGVNDIYSSADNGTTWTLISPSATYSPRSAFSYGIFTGSSGADIMVVAGGLSTSNTLMNDVWASQTSGQSWIRTTYSAPWSPRLGANLGIFSNGAMVIHGGSTAIPATATSNTYFSDAWISLDGAATWQLLANTGIARSLGAIVFDAQGYLYIFSGYNSANVGAGDAYKSRLALANIQSWANSGATNALSIPSGYSACTPYFNLGSNSAGPNTGSSSSSSSGLSHGAIAGIVIGSVVGAALILVVLCFCMRSAGAGRGKAKSEQYDSHNDQHAGEESRATGGQEVEMH